MCDCVETSTLDAQVREILGYTDGDVLTNVRRYKRYAEVEISEIRSKSVKARQYIEALQAMVPEDKAIEAAKRIMANEKGQV